jgi:hypothetical protein
MASNDVRDAGPPGSQCPGVEDEDDPNQLRTTPSQDEHDANAAGSQRLSVEDWPPLFRTTESQDYRDASTPGLRRPGAEDPTRDNYPRTTASLDVRDAGSSDGQRPGVDDSRRHSLIPQSNSRRTPTNKPLIGISELTTIVQANFQRTQHRGKGRPRDSLDLEGSHATPASTLDSLPHTDEEIYARARANVKSGTISDIASEDKDTRGEASTLRATSLPAESRYSNLL